MHSRAPIQSEKYILKKLQLLNVYGNKKNRFNLEEKFGCRPSNESIVICSLVVRC